MLSATCWQQPRCWASARQGTRTDLAPGRRPVGGTMQVLASQQALAQVNSRSPAGAVGLCDCLSYSTGPSCVKASELSTRLLLAGTPPAPSRVLYPRSTTTTLCPPGAGQACTLCHAGPSLSVRATDAEGEVAVLNSNPAGSLSWHQQMTSPDEGAW